MKISKNISANSALWTYLAIMVLALGVLARIYCYIWHKDLWLDEAMLAFSMYGISFRELFFAPLPFTQAAPLGFLLVSKTLGAVFGYSEWVLYLLPFVCGLGTLILAYKIGKRLFSPFGCFVFVLLAVGNMGLLHYTTEFKQYGIEAFCSFLMIYIYSRLEQRSKPLYLSLSIIACSLFAYTALFLGAAMYLALLIAHRKRILGFLREHFLYFLLLGGFVALYYLLYIRYQRVDGFYEYWQSFFLPHSLSAYPAFIKDTLLGVLEGFTPLIRPQVVPVYMCMGLLGLVVAYKQSRFIFTLCVCALLVWVALSILRIYPFGHSGVIGGRLSLYMTPIFNLLCCYFLVALFARWKWAAVALVAGILAVTLLRYGKIYPHWHYIQQTHALTATLQAQANSDDLVAIYHASKPAFMYYSFLEGYGIADTQDTKSTKVSQTSRQAPYTGVRFTTFDKDLAQLEQTLRQTKSKRAFLLISHYEEEWLQDLRATLSRLDSSAQFIQGKGGWGSYLIVLNLAPH